MREILFRGKALKTSEWVFGFVQKKQVIGGVNWLIHEDLRASTAYHAPIVINPSTIGQYTGLTDKNGTKIFENDIVAYWDTYNTENGQSEADCIGKVVWDDETISFQVTNRLSAESYEVLDECSVIGNIYDNPELLFDNPELLEE